MYPSGGGGVGRATRGPLPYLSQPADRALYAIEDDEESGYASSHAPSLSPASSHSSVPHYSYRPEMHAPPQPLPQPAPAPSPQSFDGGHLRAPLPRPVLSPSPPQPRVDGLPEFVPNLRDRVAPDDLQDDDDEEQQQQGGGSGSGSDEEYEEFSSERPSQIHGEAEGRTAPGEGEEHDDPGAGETSAEVADSREGQYDSALHDGDANDGTLVASFPVSTAHHQQRERQNTSEHPLQTGRADSKADRSKSKSKSKASRSAR